MKIPAMLQERLNCRSSELLLSQCLGDLYMQFLTMDQKSKERDNTQASKSSIRCRSGSSRTSASSADEIMYSPSGVQSTFSGISSPVVRSAESLIVSDSELGAMPKEGFCSAEVNPVSYDNFAVSSAAWRAPLPTTVTSQRDASSARAKVPAESCDSPESVPFESDSKGRRAWTGMNNQRVKLICSFGGRIIPRPHDGKLRYVGGETRIIAVNRHIRYSELMYKLTESHGIALMLKYQLPEDDLDALVSVSSEDDLQNMMEEHDRLEAAGGSARLRLFLFPAAEYDDYCIQNPDEDGFRSSQLYVDAVNGVPEKTSSKPFEHCLTGSAGYVDDRFFPDSTLLRLKGTAVDVGAQEFIMSNMPHQLEAWQFSSPRAFTGPPPDFSSAPPSPLASLQHHPAAPDSSLQYFQDSLNKVSVHCQLGPETRFQDFDKAGSGCSTSRQSEQHFPFVDLQRGACSPTSVVFELVSRGEHLHTGDSTSELIESPRQSSNVFNQHLEYSAISSHGHTLISDAKGPHEVVLPPQEPPQFVQQHQRMVLQKQQYEENVQRMEVVQHDTLSQCESIQQLSVPTSYLHSDNSIHSGISRKMEQRSIYQENCIPGTFLQRSASSHSIGMGGQPTHPLSSLSTYHVVAVTPSVTVEPHNVHAQHHLRPNRTFSDSRIDKPCGRRVHYGDQNSKNLKISIPSSRFLGNTTSSAEWGVEHHQQHPILFAEAGHQEADNSSLHQFERYPVPRNQFPDSTATSLSPIYGESSVPPLEQTKTRCQVAVLDRACEMSIQNSIASNRQNSRPDYHIKVNQAAEQVTLYPGYEKRYSNCGGWIGTGTATQMEYNDKNTGKMFEGGKYNEGYYDLDRNYRRDGFDSPTLLKVGGISDFASPKSEWSMSSGTVPMTKYPASRALYAPTVSQGLITEDLQLYPSSTSLRLREPNQVSGIPAGFNMFVEHNSSDPALRKADSRLPTPVTCLRNNPSAIGGARDAVSLLNRPHNFGEPSTCGETSHLQNMYLEENHFTASSLSPEEVNGWMIGGTVNNSLCENTPDFLPNIFETVNGMQSTCENVSPCTLIHKDLSDSLEGQVCQVSSAAALSCQSTQLLSAPYPWNAFDPVANDNEQREPLNVPDLPIYDRSPVGSVNAAVSGKIFLDLKNEAGNLQSDLDKGTSAGQMSLTERLAEDMICSVLGSSGNCAKYKGKSLNEEQTDENTEPHEQIVVREEDISSTSKNMPPSPLMQDEKKSALCVEHFPGVTTKVRESVGGLAKENGSCEEIKNETSEQIEDKDSNEAGQKGMTCCAAEREAISHGLQIITNADLEEIRELGSGTFGTVYHGKWRGSDVAIKRIKASCFTGPLSEQERLISDFWKEACTLSQLHHPNVVAFYGVVPDGPDGTLATVTEYMVNGSLKQVLHKKDRTIDRRKRLLIAMDIAFGMEYLHSKNIVHFDLKCENLLVNMRDPHRPICKVGDFGLSKVKHHTLVSGGVRGTLPWMAPELLSGNNSKVTEKIDVFSFGIVMWELLTGEEPYANMHCGAIIGGIVNNTLRPSIPCWCDPAWRSLMERCWSADAADRPTFSEVASELRGIAATMNLK